MECCENNNILKDKEMFVCCATIHEYTWIEYDFKFNEYNENIYNLLKCKNIIYKRRKYLNKKYNLGNRIILFLDESFENIRKHLKLKRFPISKYLNTVYQYYCDKGGIDNQSLNNSKIIKLDDFIIQILDQCFENIRKHLKLKRFPISKYLNTVYQYYCDKKDIDYQSLNNSKIIKLGDSIIQILDRAYLKYPHIKIEEPLYDFDYL